MSNTTSQVLALIGVVIGIFGTIIATTITDRSRWNRQTMIRWDERRLDAYVQYAKSIKEMHRLTLRLTASHVSLNLADPIDRKSGLRALLQAEERRTTLWENVLLLGDTGTVNAAREWRKAVWQMEQYARNPTPDDLSAKVLLAIRHVDEARDRFYIAARNSIGVGGEPVEQASWLSSAFRGDAPDTTTGSAGSNE